MTLDRLVSSEEIDLIKHLELIEIFFDEYDSTCNFGSSFYHFWSFPKACVETHYYK